MEQYETAKRLGFGGHTFEAGTPTFFPFRIQPLLVSFQDIFQLLGGYLHGRGWLEPVVRQGHKFTLQPIVLIRRHRLDFHWKFSSISLGFGFSSTRRLVARPQITAVWAAKQIFLILTISA